ncbi:MAG: methyltransferase domain-containing protein [Acidithiobacillus sp.]|uniref:methyltransferase domain-containing protein n=1 Tax=Acidithiobacillus sp. TaxID=1872118 RepID=UPI00355DDB32
MPFVNHYCKKYLIDAYPDQKDIIENNFSSWYKLNVGCGTRLDNTWINVDELNLDLTDKNLEGENIDYINIHDVNNKFVSEGFLQLDFYKLDKLNCELFDVIFSQHVVEHIMHDRVDQTLKTWISLLKPGGYFYVCTPDFKFIIDDVYGEQKYFKTIDEAWVFIFNGGTHFSGHDPINLKNRLLKLGLSNVKILPRDEDKKEVMAELVLVGVK